MPTASISVVIAVWPDAAGAGDCLSALEAQRDEQTEVIVACVSAPPLELVRQYSWVQWLPPAPDALIPNLWSQGMAAAQGEVVAITIAQFVPDADWIAQIKAAHQRLDAAGIGGPIEPPRGGSAGDWATYFLRYSNYFKYEREQTVGDIAGDNASYKRAALNAHAESITEGFWEPEFHRLILAVGQTLSFVPAIRVTQRASFGICCFFRQRLIHGRHYGRDRMRGKSWGTRVLRVTAAPLIPLVLLIKILRRLHNRPAFLIPFCRALPLLLLFTSSWAIGEAWGYLDAPTRDASLPVRNPASV